MEAWQTSLKTGGAYDSVHRIRGTDGTYRWFQCKATATRNENGEIVKWYGRSTDIHESKLAEETRSENERQLRRIADAMRATIWRGTLRGDIDRWTRRMLAFIAKSQEETDELRFLDLTPANDRDRVCSRWFACVASRLTSRLRHQKCALCPPLPAHPPCIRLPSLPSCISFHVSSRCWARPPVRPAGRSDVNASRRCFSKNVLILVSTCHCPTRRSTVSIQRAQISDAHQEAVLRAIQVSRVHCSRLNTKDS
ncbi:PAS fold-containing protein [Burkholderia sp. GAS332]|nr:PAS fold-containing protein [Burkholderia sp. GAS332]